MAIPGLPGGLIIYQGYPSIPLKGHLWAEGEDVFGFFCGTCSQSSWLIRRNGQKGGQLGATRSTFVICDVGCDSSSEPEL